jgi:hypothetical protein
MHKIIRQMDYIFIPWIMFLFWRMKDGKFMFSLMRSPQ